MNVAGDVYSYEFATNTFTSVSVPNPLFPSPGVSVNDIAHTNTKMWILERNINTGNSRLREWNVSSYYPTVSLTYSQDINFNGQLLGNGLFAVSDNLLISSNYATGMIYEIDITNPASPIVVPKFTLGLDQCSQPRVVDGDILLTYNNGVWPNKLIVTATDSCTPYTKSWLMQFDYATGNLEVDLDVSAIVEHAWGVFESGGEIYITTWDWVNNTRELYQVNRSAPYNLTKVYDLVHGVSGSSNIFVCGPNPLIIPTTTSTSTTSTSTSTSTSSTSSTSTSTSTSSTSTSSSSTTTSSSTTSTTTMFPCSCITFTNSSLESPVYVNWDNCPGVFAPTGYIIPPGGTFKACGSNPSYDGAPGSLTWTIGGPCDTTNPYPTCTVPKCYTLTTTVEDLFSSCTITFYDMYGEFQTLVVTADAINYICAQEGSINITCTGTGNTVVAGGTVVCTYTDECVPLTSTTTSSTSTTSTSTSSSTTSSSTTSTSSTTTSSSTTSTSSTTTTTTLYPCSCINIYATEVTSDTTVTYDDCDNVTQFVFIPTGSTNVSLVRCGNNPTSDNPEVTAEEGPKNCISQPNGSPVCVTFPCQIQYIYQEDMSNPSFAQDYLYIDCNTGLQQNGSIGTATAVGPCIAVYIEPGTLTVGSGLLISSTGCFVNTTSTTTTTTII
jgi:hypothetical protein